MGTPPCYPASGTAYPTTDGRIAKLEGERAIDAARIVALEAQVAVLIKVLRGVAPDRLAVAGLG